MSLSQGSNALDVDLLPASMVRKYAYCPRLFALEYRQGEWADNPDTLEGSTVHRRVDVEGGHLPDPDRVRFYERIQARSVTLSSQDPGIIARMDLIEGEAGRVHPVDYKKGEPGPDGPREPELMQLVAQMVILRDNGYSCTQGIIYYARTEQRFDVPLTGDLEERLRRTVGEMREVLTNPLPPPPLVDSPKCPRCALVGICLPDETSLLRGALLTEVRRLTPARDDRQPLYVLEQGASIGKSGDRAVVRSRHTPEHSLRLLDISHVSLYGNVQISAQALRALADRGIPIFHHSYGGWLLAVTSGVQSQNVELRVRQYLLANSSSDALPIARDIVVGKLRNQRTLLRRNGPASLKPALDELTRFARLAQQAPDTDRLFGLEGIAARLYFAHFPSLLRDPLGFDISGRLKRPPPDPVNALLSFLYALLVKDCLRALLAVGLDPYCGLYHRLRPGRPSLALDLMEEFRPLIADSVCITLLNTGALKPADFLLRGPACALREPARREVVRAYEARMSTLIRHPLFGYKVSYRRIIEIQARLLARTISGELPGYRPFTTR